jgi:hypothetical protein
MQASACTKSKQLAKHETAALKTARERRKRHNAHTKGLQGSIPAQLEIMLKCLAAHHT